MGLNLLRNIGAVQFVAGGAGSVITMELPRTALWRGLLLNAFGTMDETGTETASFWGERCARLIREFAVVANGSNTLKRISGATLWQMNLFDNQAQGVNVPTGTAPTADDEVEVDWRIPFAQPRAVKPLDTVLQAGKFSLLELRITIGGAADVIDTPAATWAFTDVAVQVGIEELLLSPGQTVNPGIFLETTLAYSYAAATGVQQIRLPTGDFYRSIFLKNIVSSEKDDTGILDVTLRSGATRFVDSIGWGDTGAAVALRGNLRNHNTQHYGITVPVGYRMLEFCPDGLLSEMIASGSLEELILEPNLAASTTNTIEIVPRTVVNPAFLRG